MRKHRNQRMRGTVLTAAAVLFAGGSAIVWYGAGFASSAASPKKIQARLVSIQPLPVEQPGEQCEFTPASASENFAELLTERERNDPPADLSASEEEVRNRKPVRMIKDAYPDFSAIAVDDAHDEVVMIDESKFNVMVYNRTDNTPPEATMTEPKRQIGGLNTWVGFESGVYVDPSNGDIYAENDDTVNRMAVFSHDQRGNITPERVLKTPHTTYGIAVDEAHNELYMTVQEAAAITVFNKTAKGDDAPIRLIQGDHTGLGDPHGIAIDPQRNLLFVTSFGSVAEHRKSAPGAAPQYGASNKPNWPIGREGSVPGSGEFTGASITVFPRDASGDVTPVQVIKGPKTMLDWPTALSLDVKRGEIYVANDTGDDILVFDENANGNVAPKRVIKGPKSLVKSPAGVFYDAKYDEVWSANFGNHSATAYKAMADGDATPLRVIRAAPIDTPTPNLGNAYAPAYDKNRDEILIPN